MTYPLAESNVLHKQHNGNLPKNFPCLLILLASWPSYDTKYRLSFFQILRTSRLLDICSIFGHVSYGRSGCGVTRLKWKGSKKKTLSIFGNIYNQRWHTQNISFSEFTLQTWSNFLLFMVFFCKNLNLVCLPNPSIDEGKCRNGWIQKKKEKYPGRVCEVHSLNCENHKITVFHLHILPIELYTNQRSYGIPKFKPICQNFFHIERINNNKTRANVNLFLVTGFEFGYAVTALYFT